MHFLKVLYKFAFNRRGWLKKKTFSESVLRIKLELYWLIYLNHVYQKLFWKHLITRLINCMRVIHSIANWKCSSLPSFAYVSTGKLQDWKGMHKFFRVFIDLRKTIIKTEAIHPRMRYIIQNCTVSLKGLSHGILSYFDHRQDYL